MGKLNVYFVGVCVHLRNSVKGVPHRVVLINASKGDHIHDLPIDPHFAGLNIGVPDTPRPDGALFTIPNAVSEAVDYDSSFERCIPRLADYSSSPLPPLSDAMTRGKDKALAAAYFDAAGKFSAEVTHGGASVAKLVVETNGSPILRIAPFDGASPEDVNLPDDATIEIANIVGSEATENDHDFLLNFKILEKIPDDASWPTEGKECQRSNRAYTTIGPGCSNTNYP
jgi:hypothetical protein